MPFPFPLDTRTPFPSAFALLNCSLGCRISPTPAGQKFLEMADTVNTRGDSPIWNLSAFDVPPVEHVHLP